MSRRRLLHHRRPASPTAPGACAAWGRIVALLFALPALLLLGALVVYPVLFSIGRSFFDASGTRFVGGENYTEMFRDPATVKAVRNTAIWVVVAPALLTGLGLILAVLVEKVRWATAFKLLLFMPMAVSFLAAADHLPARLRRGPRQGRPERRRSLRPRRLQGHLRVPDGTGT